MASPTHVLVGGVQVFIALIFNTLSLLLIVPLDFLASCLQAFKTQRPPPKHVLITGAASGIGEALALYYAGPGVTLSLTDRNGKALVSVANACKAKGAVQVNTHIGSVTDRTTMCEWISKLDNSDTPLDLVIANAGISGATAATLHHGEEENLEETFHSTMDINVSGVGNTIFPALNGMRKRKMGQIAIVASLAGAGSGSAILPAYSASKAAVRVYGEGLRVILAKDGVGVTLVCPGFIKTPMTDVCGDMPQPGKVSLEYAISAITQGIARNDALVAFPFSMASFAFTLGGVHPYVREFVVRTLLAPMLSNGMKSATDKKGE
eukprot:GDKI01039027.1.p1 GENE.GDKI01039027.1~~GDKI01039027.1.p1  ORF type:complete len:322 (+),score=74.39 GDKI01039027.1:170-1135(+)